MTRLYLVLIAGVWVAEPARADVGPFLPFAKNARAVHRVEAAETFPDHVFVVHRHGWRYDGGEHREYNDARFEDLDPGHPISIRSVDREDVVLMIVPRTEAAAYPTAGALSSAVWHDRVRGAVYHRFRFHDRETVPSWGREEVTVTHSVRRAKSGDGLELVRTSWGPMWQWYAAAGFVTAAAVFGGWRLVRRVRQPKAAGPPVGA